MILGFKPQFKKKILNRSKKHTIREDANCRWRIGKRIHFATGVRTKKYNCFKMGECKGIQKILIRSWHGVIDVFIDGTRVFCINGIIHNGTDFMTQLARNDGFKNYMEFFEFFGMRQSNKGIKEFSGRIIHWTKLKY